MTAPRSPFGAFAPITPEDMVGDRATELLTFTCTEEFDRLAIEYGFITAYLADRFVTALLDIGIDYEGLRQTEITRATTDATLVRQAATGPKLLVWSAATLEAFTLCAATGRLVWHEPFPEHTAVDGVIAATTSAEKAIELAGHALRDWGARAGVLRLNLARSRGLDQPRLHRIASVTGLVLEVATIGTHNPAAENCLHPDPVMWRTADLLELWQRPETDS
ncbi:hypothetical protein [Nocardia rhizosphaerihabitans]|uniref:Uncharacterized protein n=1 Tax=Nocardia rhizosphaerihabitans TaxID=1691570 RepID=A0ABQ2K6I2_9NOCA|nr:hypothetical protein [Nocardia rhizosphaerihabitans]GGN66095.1 hypothetical protein GCM10011610_00680 [Nocardia rhizosphaerihabitans]